MLTQPVQTASSRAIYLPLMPPELIIKIFCKLPSFTNVFALSAACHRLRHTWYSNVTPIYTHMAPRSIACEPQARAFLVDQGGPSLDTPMSATDVARMVRNSHVVEKAIQQFEREIVCRVRMDGYAASEYYGADAWGHPRTLTRTERPRFIRSYYTLWGMMQSDDPSKWSSKLGSMTLKQLYYLHEMTKLTQSIGQGEEPVSPPMFPGEPPGTVHSINSSQSEKRIALGDKIWQQIQYLSQRFYHEDAHYTCVYAKHEGFMWFVVLWDHWQASLKDLVCHRVTTSATLKPSPALEKQYIWDDSSDDEHQNNM